MDSDILENNMENFDIEKWEKIGALINTPIERKKRVVEILNYCVGYLIDVSLHSTSITRESDGMTLTGDELSRIDTIFIPLIVRIANEVCISNEDVKKIYNHVQFDFFDFLKKYAEYPNVDWEMEYIRIYAENAITHYKDNNK